MSLLPEVKIVLFENASDVEKDECLDEILQIRGIFGLAASQTEEDVYYATLAGDEKKITDEIKKVPGVKQVGYAPHRL